MSLFIFLFIILLLFILFNNLLNYYNYENFNSITNSINNLICDKKKSSSSSSSSSTKTYINSNGETVILPNCSGYNEKCLVDSEGNDTCCDNYKCIRLKNNFQYKVCSDKKDECGYNKFKNIFKFKWPKINNDNDSNQEESSNSDKKNSCFPSIKTKPIKIFSKLNFDEGGTSRYKNTVSSDSSDSRNC